MLVGTLFSCKKILGRKRVNELLIIHIATNLNILLKGCHKESKKETMGQEGSTKTL